MSSMLTIINIELTEVDQIFLLYRKRQGGIKLADEETESAAQEELNSSTVSDDSAAETCQVLESDTKQKQKADALWADFLKDVGSVPKKSESNSIVSINVFC